MRSALISPRATSSTRAITTAPRRSITGEVAAKARIQRMFSRKQIARGLAELANFESFHPERFHDAISRDRFLQDLAQIREARAALLRGTADLSAELADRPDHQRDQDRGTERHAPVDDQQDGDKRDEGEYLAEEFREPVRKGAAHLLDIG